MALSVGNVESKIDTFLSGIADTIGTEVIGKALPLIGKVGDLPNGGTAADPFAALKAQIHDALESAPNIDPADAVVAAINGLAIPDVHAVKTASGGVDITFATAKTIDTETAQVDVGSSVGSFLDLKVDAAANVVASLNAKLSFASDGTFSLGSQATPELDVKVATNLSIAGLDADLGVAKVKLTDAVPATPELAADFQFDLSLDGGGNLTLDPSLTGSAGLDLTFATTDVLAGLLPGMNGELVVGFGVNNDEFQAPTISVKNLKLDLGSYVGIVGDTFGDLADVFNAGVFGDLVDLATAPIPALDDIAHAFGLMGKFDTVGGLTGGGDGVVTIGDLAVAQNPSLKDSIGLWYQAISLVSAIRKLDALASAGEIDLGNGSLSGGVAQSEIDAATLVGNLQARLATLGLPQAVVDFLGDVDIGGIDAGGGNAASSGFSFGLFEHPEYAFKLLLTDQTVDLVKFDVPALKLELAYGDFFPILGPLGILLEGAIKTKIDVDIGYDTEGLKGPSPSFADGFFVTTAEAGAPITTNWDNPRALQHLPVGSLRTELTGGAGVGFAGSSLTVNATFGFGVYAYFESAGGDGKFRPAIEGFDCIFDPIGGRADVSVNVTLKIGFGPFSVKKSIPLAEATLADFTIFTCPPPSIEPTPQAPGLATAMPDDNNSLVLNVGDRADQRKLADDHGNISPPVMLADDLATPGNESLNEAYVIGLARDAHDDDINPADNPPPTVVPGKLDVFAFGFTQRADIPTIIKADFKEGNDSLVIQTDVSVDSDVSGGGGDDSLIGGAGRDVFRGEGDSDYLAGNDGNDDLSGGAGDDQLAGGKGGDRLDGGADIDTVDYSGANQDTHLGVEVTITQTGDVAGHGGEAEGDTLIGIESLIGTDFDDDFRTGIGVLQSLMFDGGAGSDILIGGLGEDLLIGGAGADHLNGESAVRLDLKPAYDGITYVTSWGGVEIDLQRTVQRYGDADGDKLFDIEAVEGSTNSDTLLGNGDANLLFGNDGDDTLEGRGGKDTVSGDFGDDLIYGNADGDILDGGEGIDTLSYEHVTGPVFVDLGATQQIEPVFNIPIPVTGSAPDFIVMAAVPLPGGRGRSTFENLIGTAAGDVLTGDLGDNRIEGRGGIDIIAGDEGDDILVGGAAGDLLLGGGGIDWVYYDDSPAGVTVDLAANSGVGGDAQGDGFNGIENILGSGYADDLTGDSASNVIDPNISGRSVTEEVDGGDGNDVLRLDYSRTGADIGKGVVGGFAISLDPTTNGTFTRMTASGAATLDTVHFSGIERLQVVGTRRADTIYGGGDNDIIFTGSGDDTVYSGLGADIVVAGAGNDKVAYGTNSFLQMTDEGGTTPFYLDGGRGFDTLSVSLDQTDEEVVLIGRLPGLLFNGTNLSLRNGIGIVNFEILGTVTTGSGDDVLMQPGDHDNVFKTGLGDDVIASGLGIDNVDGGFDRTGIVGEGGDTGPIITELFFERHGDLLALDYSSLAGYGVTSGTTAVWTGLVVNGSNFYDTNKGFYEGWGADPDAASKLRLDFNEIERLNVTGSNQSDVISGTFIAVDSNYDFGSLTVQVRGDDTLDGNGGNDLIFGYSGTDTLRGGDGDDILVGANLDWIDSVAPFDQTEVDTLAGGIGADLFVLGVAADASRQYVAGVLYNDGIAAQSGRNQGIVTDFDPGEGDRIQLFGRASDYRTVESGGSTQILLKDGAGGSSALDELIATVQHFTGFALDAGYVVYVDANTPAVDLAPLPAPDQQAAEASSAPFSESFAFAALAASFTVTQTDDVASLKAMLDGPGGNAGSTLTLSGSAEAFGTFENDPFGLGSGIILSTGMVEDLPGPNTVESGGSNVTTVPVVFQKIGRFEGESLDIYRVDLSGLGLTDIRSFTVRDSGTGSGGLPGNVTGFDVGAVVLSTTRLDNLDGLSSTFALDDPAILPKLDVFDYSAAGTFFYPGRQREGGVQGEFNGTINGLVDNGAVDLGRFHYDDSHAPFGMVSLGDGGAIAFNFTQSVSTTGQPLYLYVAEQGAPELVLGTVSASPDFIQPSGDLSTDLGPEGLEGDTTGLTYTFTPKAGETGFSLDVVLFSEELPEFDGASLTDIFSIRLNGSEIGALSNGAALSIRDLVFSGSGDLVLNPVGTGPLADAIRADAFTRTLRISGAVNPDAVNTLTITLKDGRDAFLDSGLLVKDGSFHTFKLPEVSVGFSGGGIGGGVAGGGSGTIVIGGNAGRLIITPPPGAEGPVEVVVTPDENLQIPGAGGPGKPVTIIFNPGDGPKELPIEAAPGAEPGETGTVHYQVRSEDPNVNGQGIAPDVFGFIAGENQAVNDPPINNLPLAYELEANVPGALGGMSIVDTDAGNGAITTTLAVQFGILTAAAAAGVQVAGSGTASVTLTGTLDAINAALAADSIVYRGPKDFFGSDTLTMTTDDRGNSGPGGPLTDTDTAAIHLNTYLEGTHHDDSFDALPGNEFIVALPGHDTITFDFALVDAKVTYRGHLIVIDGPSRHTVLSGFERYVFTDGTVETADDDRLVDDLFYYSQYHDVWQAHADADQHFHSFGWHEGRDPNAFFDTSLYLALYPDVKAAGIDPLQHFAQTGWREGRIPSPDFDPSGYLKLYPDVAAAHGNPLEHFLSNGMEENRLTAPASGPIAPNGFDYSYYLLHNPDVAAAGVDPFLHFESFGWKEGRNPNALFDTKGYLAHYTDVAAAGVNPLDHYHQLGWHEGRDPSPGFDTSAYLAAYADVATAHRDPLEHYLQFGIHEGRSPFADGVWG